MKTREGLLYSANFVASSLINFEFSAEKNIDAVGRTTACELGKSFMYDKLLRKECFSGSEAAEQLKRLQRSIKLIFE